MKYIESRTTQNMEKSHCSGCIILYPHMSYETDHFACIHFLNLFSIQFFWNFVHNSLVKIAIHSRVKEHSYYLLRTFLVATSLYVNPEIGYLTYWLNIDHLSAKINVSLNVYFRKILFPHNLLETEKYC